MDCPIDVVHVRQQQEDFKFLSHFGGKFIIHQVSIPGDSLSGDGSFLVVKVTYPWLLVEFSCWYYLSNCIIATISR